MVLFPPFVPPGRKGFPWPLVAVNGRVAPDRYSASKGEGTLVRLEVKGVPAAALGCFVLALRWFTSPTAVSIARASSRSRISSPDFGETSPGTSDRAGRRVSTAIESCTGLAIEGHTPALRQRPPKA